MRRTTPQDFWARVDKTDIDGCWPWTGMTDEKGYGRVRYLGRSSMRTHRVAWALVHGGTLPTEWVLHRCDNPPCVRPDHLFLGDATVNNQDRHAKGRTVMPTNGPDYQRVKTHCPQRHPYSGENVRYRKNGARRCAECYRIRSLAYARENRDKIIARKRALRAGKDS